MSVQALKKSGDPIAETVPEANAGYLSGFGNGFETEALPGALPVGRNSPQKCPFGLYAEQLSGSPFTAPRTANERSWLYRIRPTVNHWGEFEKVDIGLWRTAPAPEAEVPLAPMRWDPIAIPDDPLSLLDGIRTITTAGDAGSQAGMGCHVYLITRSMQDEYFYNADGEMLFVPQQGSLRVCTEFGVIDIEPGEIAVIPRGVKIRVELTDGPARGYICENYGGSFTLPERGPIGANCLANPTRLPDARRSIRGQGRAVPSVREMGRVVVGHHDRAFTSRRGRMARQLCSLQIRPSAVFACRAYPFRPCGSLDLHCPDIAV